MSNSETNEIPINAADLNPYKIIGVKATSSAAEIRTAYRKLALKCHPDKVSIDQREAAHTSFQELAFAYAILSDETRRERYDSTGSTQESVLDDEGFNWKAYFKEQFNIVSVKSVEEFKSEYQGSDEERNDIIRAYVKGKGSIDKVFAVVMASTILEDEERFRAIIDQAIEDGEVEAFRTYTKESEASKKRRRAKAATQGKEAMEYAKKIGVYDQLFGNREGSKSNGKGKKRAADDMEDNAALAALVKNRNSGRMDSMIADLEVKYGGNSKTKKQTKHKPPPPSEEEFEATKARIIRRKRTKT